jgi:hypothetical protein
LCINDWINYDNYHFEKLAGCAGVREAYGEGGVWVYKIN